MAMPPWLKKGKEAEGDAEPGDSKKEDAAEKKPNPFAKKDDKKKKKKGKGKPDFLKEKAQKGEF